ncbi:hypothetical protein [Microvirga zambiensis]|uniref:hypothetical protein n=1 Tax=Microvirga zambiensis TaxID=1402137 RepID=UPI00191EE4BF|nr:hypothetical protein [Microvirga zambiensis]
MTDEADRDRQMAALEASGALDGCNRDFHCRGLHAEAKDDLEAAWSGAAHLSHDRPAQAQIEKVGPLGGRRTTAPNRHDHHGMGRPPSTAEEEAWRLSIMCAATAKGNLFQKQKGLLTRHCLKMRKPSSPEDPIAEAVFDEATISL